MEHRITQAQANRDDAEIRWIFFLWRLNTIRRISFTNSDILFGEGHTDIDPQVVSPVKMQALINTPRTGSSLGMTWNDLNRILDYFRPRRSEFNFEKQAMIWWNCLEMEVNNSLTYKHFYSLLFASLFGKIYTSIEWYSIFRLLGSLLFINYLRNCPEYLWIWDEWVMERKNARKREQAAVKWANKKHYRVRADMRSKHDCVASELHDIH